MNIDESTIPNPELEAEMVRLARAIFNFVHRTQNPQTIWEYEPIIAAFQDVANDYVNRCDGLHPDLGFELREWATFKAELLSMGPRPEPIGITNGLTQRFVDDYQLVPESIIVQLEIKMLKRKTKK